jgi:hypothetical protein
MRLRLLGLSGIGLAALLGLSEASRGADASPAPAVPPKDHAADGFAADVVPFLAKHCYACHGDAKPRADLSLQQYQNEQAAAEDPDTWEMVLDMIQTGQMPPKERPQPTAAEAEGASRTIEAMLATLDCTGPRDAGRVTLHRLNRAEYNNTIRDLLSVDFKPAADFPEDDVGYGFDNIGDVLSLSPLLLEKYLTAAEAILDQAIVSTDPPQPAQNRLGSFRVSRGAGETGRGGTFLHSDGLISAQSYFDEGDYTIRLEVYGQQAGDEPVRGALKVGQPVFRGARPNVQAGPPNVQAGPPNAQGARPDFRAFRPTIPTIQEFAVETADRRAPAAIEAKVHLPAGTSTVAVGFLNPTHDLDAGEPDGTERRLYVRSIVMDGPYNAPPPQVPESHRRIMAHRPDLSPREAAREIIGRFATRAFRRPVQTEEVDRCLDLYDRAEAEGQRFEDRIRLALDRILVSPHFLFRVELDPAGARPGTVYPISEYELASRLSYFLWSSMPDEELFALAAQGRLRQDLEAQVRRMLGDPKSSAFVQNFAGQWLTIRKLDTVTPDPKQFPDFDADLRSAMSRETEMFFEAILREDRSILDFLDADFSFVNERLARHYGIAGVTGKEFRRVKLPANRGGILTQASILTLTSNPTRTSPVKRGKWVLDQILNTPPPPPPPDVPAFPEEKQLTGSLRQVMEMHRANTLCASCHQRMDPIGFAFENYDATGAWRDKDGPFAIDPSGVLPGGQSFRGPAELKVILKDKGDQFSRCLAEKLLTYALGRGLESYDRCAVDVILEALDANDHRFSTLLVEVIQSEPFQKRTASGENP